jgi:glycosyltransferase involved in cell wall biosynthesis
LVEATYRFPVEYVTEAAWIQQYLKENYNQDSTLVRNGIRKDVYDPSGKVIQARSEGHPPRILVEGHFGVSFKNTALGVRLAREAGAKDIWVLTGSPVSWLPGISRVFSRVPMVKTAEIYRSCDILVKLSTVEGMFGPPLEIFHCGGTAIVFDVTGHDEYIVNGFNACVVPTGDTNGVVTVLRKLISDRSELMRLQEGALLTANKWPSWVDSSACFSEWIEKCLTGTVIDRATLAEMSARAFNDYTNDEKHRLSENPWIVRRHKLSKLARILPASSLRKIKQMEAVGEVIFGGRRVY